MPYLKFKHIFDIVKKILPFILLILMVATSGTMAAGDPWLDAYRKNQKRILVLPQEESKEPNLGPVFDGFSVGASAGVGLFHGSLADYNMFAPFDEFSKYYKFGWRVHLAREIKWGLAAKVQFEKGSVEGGRLPGKQSIPVDFKTHYNTVGLVISYDVLNAMSANRGLSNNKFFLNAEVGVGLTMYRSLSYWRADDGRVRDDVGYIMTEENPPTQRYTVDSKTALAKALNIPVGFIFGYRINYKTDITFSYTLNNLATGNFDTWSRDWAANDKYSFFGLGLRYNFNRDKSDYPEKKIKEPKENKHARNQNDEKFKLFGSKKDNVAPRDVSINDPIQSRQSGKIDPALENKDLEDVKLKMFELQLKLFEMQYGHRRQGSC